MKREQIDRRHIPRPRVSGEQGEQFEQERAIVRRKQATLERQEDLDNDVEAMLETIERVLKLGSEAIERA